MLRSGLSVTVWNRTAEKTAKLTEEGAHAAATPEEAVREAEIVFTMLADGAAVEAVMLDGGALDAMSADALWIQSSTVGTAATERFATAADDVGVVFVDAPVLGTKKPAEDAQLVVLASGPEEARERCEPVFDAIGRKTVWLGEAGMGTRLKLVVNNWILCTVENIGETFVFAESLGVDPKLFLDAISGGAMDMQYAHLKGAQITNRDFTTSFPLRLARKDVALILEAAQELELPLAEATLRQFDRAVELGHGEEDMAAVYYAADDAARAST